MEILFKVTAGVDVHKDTAVVTVRRLSEGGRERQETRTFETFHDSLIALAAWMVEAGVQALALESTGVLLEAARPGAQGEITLSDHLGGQSPPRPEGARAQD